MTGLFTDNIIFSGVGYLIGGVTGLVIGCIIATTLNAILRS